MSNQAAAPIGNPLRTILGVALILPAGLACLTGLLAPTALTFITSLQKSSLVGPSQFVGPANYTALFGDPAFSRALSFTLSFVVVRVLVVAIAPLLLALAVNEFGRGLHIPVRLLFTLPLALFAPVSCALAWSAALNPNWGWVGSLLRGAAGTPQPLLGSPATAPQTLLLVDSLITFGLACGVGLIFYLAALRGADEQTPTWRTVIKPLLVSWLAGLLATIAFTLQDFAFVYALTRGGPVNSTMTLGILQYTQAFTMLRFGYGAAVASFVLIVLALLGLITAVLVVVTGLRLELVALHKPSGLMGASGKVLAGLVLGLVLIFTLAVFTLNGLTLLWNLLNSFKSARELLQPGAFFPTAPTFGAYTQLGKTIPVGSRFVNTLLPPLLSILVLQLPLAYLAALGIGALRPLGKWSEWLLLPFSPWLFVTIAPLNLAFFQSLQSAGAVGSFAALIPPISLSIPMLFILTLFFKGQAVRWRRAKAEGQSTGRAFFAQLILPSLPLVALLFCATLLLSAQDWWSLIATTRAETQALAGTLFRLQGALATPDYPILAAALALFGLPLFVFFFLAFGALQIWYLERLALTGSPSE